jgi:ABC-type amino acid transport substrate-binding protein
VIACGTLPRDRLDTLERLRSGGELRAGAAAHPPWVVIEDGRPTGLEVDLVERWAAQLGATVRWTHAPEAELIDALHHQNLDVVVAGLDTATPYKAKIGLTQPYATSTDRYGKTRHHALAARPGDSALLFALDRYLAALEQGADTEGSR